MEEEAGAHFSGFWFLLFLLSSRKQGPAQFLLEAGENAALIIQPVNL